mgnify:CR=1 FL=1
MFIQKEQITWKSISITLEGNSINSNYNFQIQKSYDNNCFFCVIFVRKELKNNNSCFVFKEVKYFNTLDQAKSFCESY